MSNPLPPIVWTLLRAATFVVFAGVIGLLVVMPELGLKLFWGLIIPLVPAIVVIAPGLWRQICPFALSNQIPRMLKITLQRDLPEFAADKAFAIAVVLFVALVALRVPVFNSSGPALAGMLIGALLAALIGGFVFKGRSGWCGTFCPLGPIQRHYGQAPTLVVPNGLCPTCVGCQKNCYDFNPQATVFDDVYDEDPRHAGQRRFFMGMMPGLILGYFLQLPVTESYPHYLFELLGATLASAAAYHFVTSFLGLNPYRTAALFGAAALVIFYVFAGPIIVNTLSTLLTISVPDGFRYGAQSLGLLVAGAMLIQGWKNERVFEGARGEAEAKAAQEAAEAMASSGFEVIDQGTGAVFHAKGGQSLLSAIQGNGLDISASCCSGLCGSDPVAILEGEENLSPPTEDELQTLRRLGLGAQTRLACCCQVLGPVRINRDVAQSEVGEEPAEEISEAYRQRFDLVARVSPLLAPDRRRPIGATRIVIIGNGIGAITTAETLRAGDAAIHITLLSVEPHAFYNRMAIAKIVDGRGTVDDLTVLPESWYDEHRINVRLGTRVASIDREQRSVTLMTGENIPYDRLVLATGARSGVPTPMFLAHRNAFVVRSAGDAQALVDYVRRTKAQSALVVGGGVLGVEATEALCDFGVSVTLVHRGAYLMDRQLDREGAFVLQSYLERRGIQVVTNAKIKSWQGAATYSSVLLEDGRVINADVFVASTGNVTNSELARGCGLNVRRGITVDAQMRTSDAAIYAVGDVAEFNGQMTGLWSTAIAQARVAAATILGTTDQFVPEKSLVTLKSNGIELFSYGDPHHSAEGCEVVMGPLFNQAWWRLHVRDGQIDMAIYAGPNGSADHVRRLLKSQLPINDYLPQLREGNLDVLRKARRA